MQGSAIGVTSRPSSAASSRQSSARGVGYGAGRARAAASPEKPVGLREKLRQQRAFRRERDGPSEEEQARMRLREVEERAAKKLADEIAEEKRLIEEAELAAVLKEKKQREEEEKRKKKLQRETERLMREAEELSGAVGPAITDEPTYYWWDAHQNYKLNDEMEVCSPSIGDPNKHVRMYLHTTFKEFIEERGKLARHVYPELMHLCFERGVAFSPIDLFWQTSNMEEANQPEQVFEPLEPQPRIFSHPSLQPLPSSLCTLHPSHSIPQLVPSTLDPPPSVSCTLYPPTCTLYPSTSLPSVFSRQSSTLHLKPLLLSQEVISEGVVSDLTLLHR